jgi:hypothetical protein
MGVYHLQLKYYFGWCNFLFHFNLISGMPFNPKIKHLPDYLKLSDAVINFS